MTAKFLIEVPHEPTMIACVRAVEALLKSGSHFVTRADWGCKDGEHKAWIIVEVENKDEARAIVPPAFRSDAKIVQLNSFTIEEMESIARQHNF
jgi:nicotinate-nucleotide pyrophosphorylase